MRLVLKLTLAASLVAAVGLLACVQFGAGAPEPQASAQPAGSARGRFTMPKLFDFENYKRLFHKSYASLAETLVRHKLFLSRAIRSLVSMVNYKRGKLAYYLKLNKFSDQSKRELDRMKNNQIGDGLFSRKVSSGPRAERSGQSGSDEDTLVDPKDLSAVLARLAKVYPNNQDIAELRTKVSGTAARSRQRRKVDPEKRSELSADDLINEDDREKEAAAEAFAEATQQIAPASSTSSNISEQIKPMRMYVMADKEEARQHFLENNMLDSLEEFDKTAESLKPPPGNEDLVYFDHRDSSCFLAPRSQGRCESCYAFVLIAIAEWAYCKATGELVAFSEQYMVDCGHFLGNSGCNGGNPVKAVEFAYNFGFELLKEYPYTGKLGTCPYEASQDISTTGLVRMNADLFAVVPMDWWEMMIQQAPLYITVSIVGDFMEYGSGVWDSSECAGPNHGVVLVGHGREDGQEYWVLRNSFSVGWGEGGYMKISKNSECLTPKEGIFVGFNQGSVDLRFEENEKHDTESIKKRLSKNLFAN